MADTNTTIDKSYAGNTKPHRHRVIRRLLMTLLVAAALVAAGMVVLVVRAAQTNLSRSAPEQVEEPLPVVEDTKDPSAAEPDPEPEPEPEPQTVELKLMMVGDILMHEGVIYSGDVDGDGIFNFDHLFAPIAADVAEADVAILNQETILGGHAFPFSGYPVFNSPQELGDAEVKVGFDVILKATNHTLDLGYDGVRTEIAYWRDNHPEIAVIGMADPDGTGVCPAGGISPAGPYIVEKDGLKVGLLNYTEILNGNVDETFDWRVVSLMFEEGIRNDIQAARDAGADFVVVMTHWGAEYTNEPTESERFWANILYDAGVDVVIGGHPHVIQPVEVMDNGSGHKMLVCWSVGNFVSSQPWAYTMVGGMVKVSFVKTGDEAHVGAYEFIPVINQRQPNTLAQTAYKLSDYTDELAAASDISLIDGGNGSTLAWYQNYCAGVLGESFDWNTMSVHGTVSE